MKSAFLALLSGALLAGSFPSFKLWPLAWVGLIPFFFALEDKRPFSSFRLGFLAGCAFYLILLYWILVPMTVYGGVPHYYAVPVLFLLVIYLALYFGAFALLLGRLRVYPWLSQMVLVASSWVALDLARTYLLTGFPWGSLGYSQVSNLKVIQMSDLTGVYGVTFVLVMANFALYQVIRLLARGDKREALLSPALVVAIGLLLAVVGYGWLRIGYFQALLPQARTVSVAILQGNIDQGVKWDDSYRRQTIAIYDRLNGQLASSSIDLVIWPETAVPFLLDADRALADYVLNIPRRDGAYLLFGSPGYQLNQGKMELTNRAYLVSPQATILAQYDKMHLVPFGEYTPLKFLFPFMGQMVTGPGEFVEGKELTIFPLPGGNFATLICYEAIFPGMVRKFVKSGAVFLVNITNDAWFGRTGAPFQHQEMAVFRAVENRVFLARSANTGVSALVDWTGKILKRTDIFTRETIIGKLSVHDHRTFYTRYGDIFAYATALATLLGLVFSWRRRGERCSKT